MRVLCGSTCRTVYVILQSSDPSWSRGDGGANKRAGQVCIYSFSVRDLARSPSGFWYREWMVPTYVQQYTARAQFLLMRTKTGNNRAKVAN